MLVWWSYGESIAVIVGYSVVDTGENAVDGAYASA